MKKSAKILEEKILELCGREVYVRMIETDYSGGRRIQRPSAGFVDKFNVERYNKLLEENRKLKTEIKRLKNDI